MQSTSQLDALSLFPAPGKARIIFVDDDELVLRSIRRLLAGREENWEIEYLPDGHAALSSLGRTPADVIVSDLQMGPLGGAGLLGAVQERYPDVVRIVLTGETDTRMVLRTVPFAHQFLAKPFDAARLRGTLRRACGLRGLLVNESVRAVVGRSSELPAAPAAYVALTDALRDRETSIARVASIVESDVGIAARVLHMASSSFFGIPRRITTVAAAVAFLGLERIRTLVLTCEIVKMFRPTRPIPHFSIEALEEHGLRTARLARALLGSSEAGDDAFLAGLLHRVGRLVLASRVPHRFAEVLDRHVRLGRPLVRAEEEALHVTNTQVGAYLLGLWGLRQAVVEAVAYHARPERLEPSWGIPGAVHIASILADNPDAPLGTEPTDEMSALPGSYLARLGVASQIPAWRELAKRMATKGEQGASLQ